MPRQGVDEPGSIEFTIDAAEHHGQTLVIRTQRLPASDQAGGASPAGASVGLSFEKGTARPCKVVDA